jgi:SOS-response transcriptional repressor LexA
MRDRGIGGRLRRLRGDLSQEVFARRLGLRRPVYRRYETGERHPPIELLIKLARHGQTTIDWILLGKEDVSAGQPMLVREPKAAYGRAASQASAIPVLSRRAAGRPPKAITAADIELYLPLPTAWAGEGQLVITMPDDSMEPAIKRDDLVAIEPVKGRLESKEGALVAVWLREPAGLVVRRLSRDDNHWLLVPENHAHRAIVLPKKGAWPRVYRVTWWFHRAVSRPGRGAQK